MGILAIIDGSPGLSATNPSYVYIETNDTLAEVLVPGYLSHTKALGYNFFNTDTALVYTTDHANVTLNVTSSGNTQSLVFPTGGGGGGAPTTLTYVTQTNETGILPNSTFLSGYATGFLTNTSGVGASGAVVLTGSANIAITNGSGMGNPVFNLTTTGVTAGSYTLASLTVDAYGRISAASNGTAVVESVSGTAGEIASTGGVNPVLSLVNTAVTPGAYTNASITVDSFGRLTLASSGTAPVTSVSGTAGEIASTGGATPVLSLVNTAVTPGAYTNATLTVDSFGRLTAVSSGTAPVTSVTGTANQITSTGGATPVIGLSSTVIFPGTVTLNADPTTALEAATKQYVDSATAGLNLHASCFAASTANLTATYNNGTSGVGATLTNAGAFAVFALDGTTPAVNDRVLIKDQTASADNGIYTVTDVGDTVSVNWVLTRATDYDTVPNVEAGDFTLVINGTVNKTTGWMQTSTVTTIGTDPIVFVQFTVSSSGVTSVSGTAARITSTGGTTPVIDIDPTYVGQTSITTLGTVSTGTWQGTILAPAYGGTGINNSTNTLTINAASTINQDVSTTATPTFNNIISSSATPYTLICGGTSGTTPLQSVVSTGTTGQVLTSNGAAALPTWTTPTTGAVTSVSGTANRITSTGGATPVIDIAGTYVGQSSITTLGTVTTGVWNATLLDPTYGGTGVNNGANTITLGGNLSTAGSLTTSGAYASTFTMTGITSVTFPTSGLLATSTTLGTVTTGIWNATPITVPYGGTGNTSFTAYSIICAGTTSTGTFQNVVGVGTSGQVLTSNGATALPTWQTASSGTVTSVSGTAGQIDVATGTTAPVISIDPAYVGQASITTLGTVTTGTWNATTIDPAHGGTGVNNGSNTITLGGNVSTAGSLTTAGAFGATFTFTGTTSVTFPTSGTLSTTVGTVTSVSGTANRITVATGTTTPVVDIAATYVGQSSITTLGTITTGTWNGTTIDVPDGGTGDISFTAYSVVCGGTTSTSALQNVAGVGTSGQILTSNGPGALPTWQSGAAGTVTAVNGTAGRITSTGGTAPTIDIDAAYVGQTSITTLGTVTTGTWNGTVIDGAYGGTGVANTGKTITLGGNLTTSGAFASTFTMTGATNVTFPTSGTLLTSASLTNYALLNATNGFGFNIQYQEQLKDYSETVNALGNVSGATTFDLTLGNVITATATGAVTITVTNVPASGQCASISLVATNFGAFTITWMTGIVWSGGSAPTLQASGTDVLVFFTTNGGTTWYGYLSGAQSSSGTVTSVSGTAGQIDVATGTTTPVISIDAAYVGQSSITTLGTVTTGTWNGSVVAGQYGGTGVANTGKTITLGGNLTTSGAFAATFTLTGATSVTFPTSGTLSTTTGTVTSVSGTAGQISVATGTTTPVISIDTAYVGQNSINTVGTIGTGTWNGTPVTVPYGGTGASSFVGYSVICGGTTTTGTLQSVATVGTAGQVLTSNGAGALPTWATPTTGTVTSVSGTANRITSTGGATPVIDISASYVGQSSITTLGTIATGTWNGDVVGPAYGGTGVNNGSNTISLNGPLTLAGAFTSTFTFTGNTSVTFPTNGTLGTVTSVSGTAGQIDVAIGTTTPVISIDSAYVGQTSINTVGTIGTGTWNGAVVGPAYGGTGVNNGSNTISLNGPLTLAGAFTSTFTFTGNTSVTFPTNGTLGTVTSVSGTAGQIDVAIGTTTPVISIDSAYVGQTSINTVGTIGTGTWNGAVVGPAYGGTGVNNGSNTISLNGPLTLAGAFTSTFTFTGNTSVTFPTNGTLATTANVAVTNATNSFGFNEQYQMLIQDYSEQVSALGNVSGATSMNLQNGNVFSATVTAATTFSITNVPASGTCASVSLVLTNGGAGAVTWMSGTKWPGGTAPTLTASGVDVLVFFTVNAGTTWYGNVAGQAYA